MIESVGIEAQAQELPGRRKRRFSADTANDLLFWGCHLLIVSISLALMWIKVDGVTSALRNLIAAQQKEIGIVESQVLQAQGVAQEARNAEHQRSVQFSAAAQVLDKVTSKVNEIHADIKMTLDRVSQNNDLILQDIERSRAAALASESAAKSAVGASQAAAGAAGSAANAASRAAAASSRTTTVIATKVVTTQDKRQLEIQQRKLAQKEQQLSRTIKQVKRNGPNLLQQMFH